ncbi:aryl-sulfate sulfotransferase [Eudoraea adriatica]|uniref:aryl-sulfate sulfotransferase n=1 Tax=Eudoraea adriatica TaxID=446681 RepID=UPI00036F8EAD|nr:aryl-sulfate sulfotransferase [Eudoraea adriatica]
MKLTNLLFACALLLTFSCKQEKPKQQVAEEIEIRQWNPEDLRAIAGNRLERGLIKKTDQATPGYTLFSPYTGTVSYLIDKDGNIVHSWKGELSAALNGYLLENGHLIRVERDVDFPTFAAGGAAGRIREYDWEGNLVWDFEYANEKELIHHDIEVLPNGNILAISYELITPEQAISAGKDPGKIAKAGIWPDKIIEIKPIKPVGGEIVWEWHMWDHLIQDLDPNKPNYGVIAENPRRIDVNLNNDFDFPPFSQEQIDMMKKHEILTSNFTEDNITSDISHSNAVSYNPELDQIAISIKHFGELFIIDHSTTTEEAKGSTGGKWGHGGDLLYRWGNPENYGRGTKADRTLFNQHEVRWVPQGYEGAGNLTMFNNDIINPNNKMPSVLGAMMESGSADPEISIADIGNYSAVYEITMPTSKEGVYMIPESDKIGPNAPSWQYTAPDKYSLFSPIMSSAQRLKNGNTLITSGIDGRILEVTPVGKTVWEYRNQYKYDYKLPDGSVPQPGGSITQYGLNRSLHYDADYEAFKGKELKPIVPQPEPFIFKMPPPPAEQDSVH